MLCLMELRKISDFYQNGRWWIKGGADHMSYRGAGYKTLLLAVYKTPLFSGSRHLLDPLINWSFHSILIIFKLIFSWIFRTKTNWLEDDLQTRKNWWPFLLNWPFLKSRHKKLSLETCCQRLLLTCFQK